MIVEVAWDVILYPKTEEDKERFRKYGSEDKDGRFYRSGFFFPRRRSLRRIIKDEIEHISNYDIGSSFGCEGFWITKIAEDEFEINGNIDKKYLPEVIKFIKPEDQ